MERILALQRVVGNAAVVQLIGGVAGASDSADVGAGAESTVSAKATGQAEALFAKGEAAYRSGDYGRAYDYYGQAYGLYAQPGLVYNQAQALRRLGGRREEAIALYQRYLDSGATEASTRAQAHLDKLRAEGAEPQVAGAGSESTVSAKATGQAEALFAKGEAAYRSGDYAHAYDYYGAAYELDPRPELLYNEAQALRRLGGRREEAIALYQRYLDSGATAGSTRAQASIDELTTPESAGDQDLDTAQAEALFAKGEAALKRGDYAHAYDYYGQAYDLDAKADLVFNQAQALKHVGGRLAEAIALFERYLGLEGATAPDRATRILAELRAPESTGDAARDTAQAEALFAKGEAAYRSGDYGRAYDYYGQAYGLRAQPGLVYNQAQALRCLGGRREEAIALYQQYLDSGDTEASTRAQAHLDKLRAEGAEPQVAGTHPKAQGG